MKTRLGMALAAGIVFWVAGAVLSQGGGPTSGPTSGPAPVIGAATMAAPASGVLVRVAGYDLILNVRQPGGEMKDVAIPTDEKTEISVDYEPGKLADLKSGMRIIVNRVPVRGAQPARLVVTAATGGLMGPIVRVDGPNVILRAIRPGSTGEQATVVTDEKTKVLFLGVGTGPGRVGQLAELRPGMVVIAIPETGTAAKIIVGRAMSPSPASLPAASSK